MTEKRPQIVIEEFILDDFNDMEKVDEGEFGLVLRAKSNTFCEVAVKIYKKAVSKEEIKEVHLLLENSRHPNIIKLYGIIMDNENVECLGYVMDLMHCSLSTCIHDANVSYKVSQAYSWIEQTASGLKYLHDKKVYHRDIKPSNILTDESLKKICLCDFGIARLSTSGMATGGMGTPYYIAPENMDSKEYDYTTDIYSLSITIWEIFHRRKPFHHLNYTDIMPVLVAVITKDERPVIDSSLDLEIRDLLIKGWNKDPRLRPKLLHFIELFRKKPSEPDASSLIPYPSNQNAEDNVNPIVDADVTLVSAPLIKLKLKESQLADSQQSYVLHKVELSKRVVNRFLRRCSHPQVQQFQDKLQERFQQERIVVLPPKFLSKKNKTFLENWVKVNGLKHPSQEISVLEGDVLLLTNANCECFQKALKEFSLGKLSFQTPHGRIEPLPQDLQLDAPREANIVMICDHRLNWEPFCSNFAATYSRKILGRLQNSKTEETRIPLDGVMNSFSMVKGGKGSLTERFAATVKELKEVRVICLFIFMEYWKNQDISQFLDSTAMEEIVIVGVCEKIYTEQAEKKLVEIYGAKTAKCRVLYLQKADLFERTEGEQLEAISKVLEACFEKAAASVLNKV